MPFPRLEPYKSQDPEVAQLLSALEVYLDQVLHRPPHDYQSFYDSPAHDINPRWVARELKTSLARAQTLLFMSYQAGIVRPRYDVYCPENDNFIESFHSVEQLPSAIECPHHDFPIEHNKDTYLVALFFEFDPAVVQGELRMAV